MASFTQRLAAAAGSESSDLEETRTGMRPRVSRHCRITLCPVARVSLNPIAARRWRGTTPTTTGWLGRYLAMRRALRGFGVGGWGH